MANGPMLTEEAVNAYLMAEMLNDGMDTTPALFDPVQTLNGAVHCPTWSEAQASPVKTTKNGVSYYYWAKVSSKYRAGDLFWSLDTSVQVIQPAVTPFTIYFDYDSSIYEWYLMSSEVYFPDIDRNKYMAWNTYHAFKPNLSVISDGTYFKFNTRYYVYVYYKTQDVYGSVSIPASTVKSGGSFTISGIIFRDMDE